MRFCFKCGYEADSEIHKREFVWFHHDFVSEPVESTLVEKMANQIAKEIDDQILSDLFYKVPDDHPLGYMIDLGRDYTLKTMKATWTIEEEKPSILPKRFVCVAFGPNDYDDLWDPHPFGLEDEPWHTTDLRDIRMQERYREEACRKKIPWLLRLLGAK